MPSIKGTRVNADIGSRLLLMALVALFTTACSESGPTSLQDAIEAGPPGPPAGPPDAFGQHVVSEIPGPLADYLDGRRAGGDPAFKWMPPLIRYPSRVGRFNPRLVMGLAVQVCRWDGDCAAVEHRVPGSTSGSLREFVRVSPRGRFYSTTWVSNRDIPGRETFRAEAYLHAFQMGYVDLMAVRSFPDLWEAWRRGLTPFVPGWPLSIRFRIDDGIFEGAHNPVPILEIVDGRDDGGTPGFHFVRPVQPTPTYTGTFDPTLARRITVEICGWVGTGCIAPIASLGGNQRAHRIRMSQRGQFYEARWDTRGMDPTMNYRAIVFLDGAFQGHADIDLVQRGFACTPRSPENTYCRTQGEPARIRFRIDRP